MQTCVKSPRNGCALHGVLQTVQAINGVVPIVHSNSGCAIQSYLSNKSSGLDNTYFTGQNVFSTDAQERHVIFGGASRLREQIKNTIKVVNGDLYIVLNSCVSAMVGDDVEAMTRESREQGETIIESLTAGLHGDSHYGYESVVTDIIKKLPLVVNIPEEKNDKLVNIFGILPKEDIYYRGNLAEIKRILEGIGLSVNTFFSYGNGVEEFKNASTAAISISFSRWGNAPAKALEELYGVKNVEFSNVPTGPIEVAEFVRKIADELGVSSDVVDAFIEKEEKEFDYYYQGVIDDFYNEAGSKSLAIVADESVAIRVGGFLKRYIGADIKTIIVTDRVSKKESSDDSENDVLNTIANEVYYTQDGKEISDILSNNNIELVLGSSLDRNLANGKKRTGLDISFPAYNKAIVNKSYVGIRGALTLLEDYLTVVKEDNHAKELELLEYIGQNVG